MSSMFFGNSIVEWEKRIEAQGMERKYNRIVPFFDGEMTAQPERKESRSFLARFFNHKKEEKPVFSNRKKNPCQDTQPC